MFREPINLLLTLGESRKTIPSFCRSVTERAADLYLEGTHLVHVRYSLERFDKLICLPEPFTASTATVETVLSTAVKDTQCHRRNIRSSPIVLHIDAVRQMVPEHLLHTLEGQCFNLEFLVFLTTSSTPAYITSSSHFHCSVFNGCHE